MRMKKNSSSEESISRMPKITGITELCIDHDHITISVGRFNALVKAEVTMSIIQCMYHTSESYNYEKVLEAIFGPRKKEENA